MTQHQETVQIPVPAYRISANSIIHAGDLTQKKYIKAALSSNVITNSEEIIGKATVTDLFPGELILKDKLKSDTQVLQAGEVFVTVRTENLEQILGGNICRNMMVDVLYTDGPEKPPIVLAESAVVAAVLDEKGSSMTAPVNIAQAAMNGIAGTDKPPKFIILKVKRTESYEFTRPLNGGHILITQISEETNSNQPNQEKEETID